MKKKKYVKPSMEVYYYDQQPKLLAGSGTDGGFEPYVPTPF